MLIPREHKVQHSNPIKDLTDGDRYIEAALAAQAGDQARSLKGLRNLLHCRPLSLKPSASVQTGCSSTPTPRLVRGSASRESARCHGHLAA